MHHKVLLVELNEVPHRVISEYVRRRPQSEMASLVAGADRYTTVTDDSIQLDPWISWSTFHRGVPDTTHGILHLGQPLTQVNEAFPPSWQIVASNRKKVGVFGSLHSSCTPPDVDSYAFYLPDYFDDRSFASPKQLKAFQDLNLVMTRDSARNVSRRVPIREVGRFLAVAPSLGLQVDTVKTIGAQLVAERKQPGLRIRRRNLQPLLMTDLFLKRLAESTPDYATFYTNHVAAAMHRYWAALFPEDYRPGTMPTEWTAQYSAEILCAMDVFDGMLSRMLRMAQKLEMTVVVASSMGQAAIETRPSSEFLTITNTERFMGTFGIHRDAWSSKPAMVPCVNVTVDDGHAAEFEARLEGAEVDGHRIERNSKPTAPCSFDARDGGFFQLFIQFDSHSGSGVVKIDGATRSFAEVGLGLVPHEDGVNGTAQHVSEGSLFVVRADQARTGDGGCRKVSTVDFLPSLLAALEIDSPEYLGGAASIPL